MSRDDANMAFAQFGQWAFDAFWSDGDPGFLDGPDLQDKAVRMLHVDIVSIYERSER